jgi:DNA repair exonuclease SbcCD ATPase subunit
MNTETKKDAAPGNSPDSRPDASAPVIKSKAALIIIWALSCLAFVCILWAQSRKHAAETEQSAQTIASYSNHVATLEDNFAQQVLVNATLETNLAATKLKASNDLAAIETTLSTTTSSLEKAQAEVKAAEAAMAEKDKKIAQLADQNTELDKESYDLRGSITILEGQIAATQKKLDSSEGDKKLLLAELTRLQAQKDELEKKLSDLAFLKETVRKLKEDLAVARRLDWIRRGIYDAIAEKGGERLTHPLLAGSPANSETLDVELRQNGAVKMTPPASTNSPPAR